MKNLETVICNIKMEFIRTIRNKRQTQKQNEIQRQAEDTITLSDFLDAMYIAYNGER